MGNISEKKRFENAMVAGGFAAPVRSQYGGYLYAEDAKAWGAWQLAVSAEREACEVSSRWSRSPEGREYKQRFDTAVMALRPAALESQPAAWLVKGGKMYADRAFSHQAHAERSIADRKDGARLVPLYEAMTPNVEQREGAAS